MTICYRWKYCPLTTEKNQNLGIGWKWPWLLTFGGAFSAHTFLPHMSLRLFRFAIPSGSQIHLVLQKAAAKSNDAGNDMHGTIFSGSCQWRREKSSQGIKHRLPEWITDSSMPPPISGTFNTVQGRMTPPIPGPPGILVVPAVFNSWFFVFKATLPSIDQHANSVINMNLSWLLLHGVWC